MKLYCVEQEQCGWVGYIDHTPTNEELVCPACYDMALAYEDNEKPTWLREKYKAPYLSQHKLEID